MGKKTSISKESRDEKLRSSYTPIYNVQGSLDSSPPIVVDLSFKMIPGYFEDMAVVCPHIQPIEYKIEIGTDLGETYEKLATQILEKAPLLDAISDNEVYRVSLAAKEVIDHCFSVFRKTFKRFEKHPNEEPSRETLLWVQPRLSWYEYEIIDAFQRKDTKLMGDGLDLLLNWEQSSKNVEDSTLQIIQVLFFKVYARSSQGGRNPVLWCETVKHKIALIEKFSSENVNRATIIPSEELERAYQLKQRQSQWIVPKLL